MGNLGLITHPLFAALSRYFHQSRVGATQVGQGELLRTERNASHGSIDAGTLVLAVWLKTFPILVDFRVVFTGSAF